MAALGGGSREPGATVMGAKERKCRSTEQQSRRMVANRIRHTVAFALVHADGSPEERDFLDAAEQLGAIPSVRQVRDLDGVRRSIRLRSLQPASRSHSLRSATLAPQVSEFLELGYAPR
jgi:hypothetical protein